MKTLSFIDKDLGSVKLSTFDIVKIIESVKHGLIVGTRDNVYLPRKADYKAVLAFKS